MFMLQHAQSWSILRIHEWEKAEHFHKVLKRSPITNFFKKLPWNNYINITAFLVSEYITGEEQKWWKLTSDTIFTDTGCDALIQPRMFKER